MIDTVAETGSTNDDMIARAAAGVAEGHWLRAEQQVRGRGRQGRAWTSDPGNLAASTLVRLRPTDAPPPTLALVAAVALQETAAMFAADAAISIKWPNDLMADGAKLSGILLERRGDAVVIGFGVNLASAPMVAGRVTTSLSALAGAAPAPAAFLDVLATVLADWVLSWRRDGLVPVRARWLERAHPVGTALTVRTGEDDRIDGTFEGLDEQGALLLRTPDGVRTILAGDVMLL